MNTYVYGDYAMYIPNETKIVEVIEVIEALDKGNLEPLPLEGSKYKGIKIKRAPFHLNLDRFVKINLACYTSIKAEARKEVQYG